MPGQWWSRDWCENRIVGKLVTCVLVRNDKPDGRGGKSIGTWEPSSQKFFGVESFPENFPENVSTF